MNSRTNKNNPAQELFRLTAADAARRIVAGDISSEELVRSCLDRIAAREPRVGAWAHIDPAAAIREARRLDRIKKSRGPLHGIPVGVKDIIDTATMPTACNSAIYKGHRPARDATVVARLRAAGAIILGKTETSEYAYLSPARTHNPHNPRHTPGGSSSGSAAAVGDCMVPLALGTQTGGSTIRPAAYCGVHALKPTYRRVPVDGIKSLSNSYDTIGLIARSVGDLALLEQVLSGEPAPAPRGANRAPRIGYCETPFWPLAEPATRRALSATARALEKAGYAVERVTLPDAVVELSAGFYVVVAAEAAWSLAPEYRDHKKLLSARARRLVEMGMAMSPDRVQRVRAAQTLCTLAVDRLFDRYDALLTPAAPGEPEKGRALGNNEFNRLWTAMHLPCLTIPAGTGPQGLPIGIQLVARRNTDRALLGLGERVARILKA